MVRTIDFDSPAVQSYLTILQSVITRMAANSASAKTWCVALVSAIVVVVADKGEPRLVWIALLPVLLLGLLDAYYLGLERLFRDRYNEFIAKLHEDRATAEDVFLVSPGADMKQTTTSAFKALSSVSVWPFYGVLTVMLAIVRLWVL
jgi:hypothetical protein